MSELVPVLIETSAEEARGVRTLRFRWDVEASPGQFVMVWIPGVDEIPMSLSCLGDPKGVTVKAIGDATKALSSLCPGDYMAVRGPYGNGFRIPEGRVLFVGGGVGMAAIMPALEAVGDPARADVIIGARTADEVMFEEKARSHSSDVRISTDDGSMGFQGNAVQLMKGVMDEKRHDMVIACGPEVMLFHLHKECTERGVACQLSLERFMKCGVGLCGSCVIDGRRVCVDGPVFTGDEIAALPEFGRSRRDEAGRKVPL